MHLSTELENNNGTAIISIQGYFYVEQSSYEHSGYQFSGFSLKNKS